jgi:hypothetical protein
MLPCVCVCVHALSQTMGSGGMEIRSIVAVEIRFVTSALKACLPLVDERGLGKLAPLVLGLGRGKGKERKRGDSMGES